MFKRCCVFALIVLVPGAGFGQDMSFAVQQGNYFTRNYRSRQIADVGWGDTNRIDRLMRAGKIYLSLRDAIALALENNLDIEYARFNPKLSETNLLRANAGQLLRNVNTGVNQGPSSVSLGALAGANSLGASSFSGSNTSAQNGVLSGLNVQLAGTAIPNLDPVAYGFWEFSHITSPQSSTVVTGTNYLVSQFQAANYGIQQSWLSGTTATLGMTNTLGLSQNSPYNNFNPTTSAALSLQITQNLLQGWGIAINNRAIRVAKNQLRTTDLAFEQQVIATVRNVVDLYWDLVSFSDGLRVRQQAYDLNKQLYDDNKRRAELGALAEIDLIQTEAEMKSAQQDVINADAQLQQQEAIVKSVITRNGLDNLAIATARIVPTDHIATPTAEPVVPIQDLIAEALSQRPEVEQNRIALESARINMLGTRNAMLPQLQAFLNLANNSQVGQVNTIPVPIPGDPNGNTIVRTPADVNPFFLGGYGTALGQVFSRNFPNYTVGLQMSIPLRNRAAQADAITDQLNYRQSEIQNRQLVNNIKLNVINAAVALSQSRAAYETAAQARALQEQTLAGERRKYDLGASTILNVLIVQRDTITREVAEVSALNTYVRSRTAFEQITGRILKDYEVDIQEAKSGTVKREPDLPIGPGGATK